LLKETKIEAADKIINSLAESMGRVLVLQEAVYRNPNIDITDLVLKQIKQ
jgi:Skp family chaperone for outer membrane proteins